MQTIKNILAERFMLSPRGFETLQNKMTVETFKKGDTLLRQGEVHQAIYFIEQGAMRSFYINEDGKDITVWFGFEGDVAASLGNFISGKPSLESIEMLENSTLVKINNKDLKDLFEVNIEIANFGRKVAETALIEMEEQILLTQFSDAKSKYQNLIKRFPQLLQRVKLGHIASYLGITQVTLSRIRAEQ
jgi:CRP-like cAMP-binding protein